MWTKAILTAMAETVDTSIIGGGSVEVSGEQGIYTILKLVVTILTYGLGVAATIGVVIAGVIYLTARDNPEKVATAKKRLIDVVIGLVAWAAMAAVLNWLIPGGLNLNELSASAQSEVQVASVGATERVQVASVGAAERVQVARTEL